jgi:hypothetical protein
MPHVLLGTIAVELFLFKRDFRASVGIMTLLAKIVVRQILGVVPISNNGSSQAAITCVASVDEGALFLSTFFPLRCLWGDIFFPFLGNSSHRSFLGGTIVLRTN